MNMVCTHIRVVVFLTFVWRKVTILIVPVDFMSTKSIIEHAWDIDLKQLSLQHDRTKLICHNVVVLLFLRSNINFVIMGDKFARQPNNSEEEELSAGQMIELCCYYTIKYDTKVDIHVGEQLILNLIMSHQRT